MKIALVADTHIPTTLRDLPRALLDGIQGVAAILHAGDIVSGAVLKVLAGIAPVHAVTGNMDPPELRNTLPDRRILDFVGHQIGLKHGHQPHGVQSHYIGEDYASPQMSLFFQLMSAQLPGADIIVFGHFHRPIITQWHGVLFINPGAVAPSYGVSSYAMLELGERVEAHIVPLEI